MAKIVSDTTWAVRSAAGEAAWGVALVLLGPGVAFVAASAGASASYYRDTSGYSVIAALGGLVFLAGVVLLAVAVRRVVDTLERTAERYLRRTRQEWDRHEDEPTDLPG